MGSIIFGPGILVPSVSEIVGYKSGLALTRKQILGKLQGTEHLETLRESDTSKTGLRSEEFEKIILEILYRIGNIASPINLFPTIALFRRYKGNPRKLKLAEKVTLLFIKFFKNDKNSGPIDTKPFIEYVVEIFGPEGGLVGFDLLEDINEYFHRDVFSRIRMTQWKDTKSLNELFKSESLDTYYGSFFDQRFIDYLYKNFDDINKINWRKFEGLTAEYFDRAGFQVEIGRGRKDGGVDIRVWPKDERKDFPPAILIQCKREKKTIGIGVVKILYADIHHERAKSGLIVTSSALSKDARELCKARAYPIGEANRETLKKWVERMHSPGTGVFLGK
jgi:restriction endonuclease